MRHETNTFSPVPTPLSDFGRVGPTDGPARGSEALQAYRGTNNPVAAYIDLAAEERAELTFAIAANAHPSEPAGAEVVKICAEALCAAGAKGCVARPLDLLVARATAGLEDGDGTMLSSMSQVERTPPSSLRN